jgi:hypothetical protein
MVHETPPTRLTWEDTSKRFQQIPQLGLRPRSIESDSNEPQAADVTAGGGTISTLSSGTAIPVPFTARISSDSEFNTDVSLPPSQAMVLNHSVETGRTLKDFVQDDPTSSSTISYSQNVSSNNFVKPLAITDKIRS